MKQILLAALLLVACSLTAHAQTLVQVPEPLTVSQEIPFRQDDVLLLPNTGGVILLAIDSLASDGVEYPPEEEFTIYPNPSTDISGIDYSISSQKHIEINVYNVFGAEIATIQNGVQYQGQHSMKIETDSFQPGIYVVRFAVDSVVTYKKFVVAR